MTIRKCRLLIKDAHTGKETVLYQGSQKTHMERMRAHLITHGQMARIECDPPQPRRVKINSITGKPKL